MKKSNSRPNVHVVAAAEFVCWFCRPTCKLITVQLPSHISNYAIVV